MANSKKKVASSCGHYCCVPNCKNCGYSIDPRTGDRVRLHGFPRDPDWRKKWMINIKRKDLPDNKLGTHRDGCCKKQKSTAMKNKRETRSFCCIKNCSNHSKCMDPRTGKRIRLHRFPNLEKKRGNAALLGSKAGHCVLLSMVVCRIRIPWDLSIRLPDVDYQYQKGWYPSLSKEYRAPKDQRTLLLIAIWTIVYRVIYDAWLTIEERACSGFSIGVKHMKASLMKTITESGIASDIE
ncbi:hypothetical protein CAPTEDRAFT_206967 [Capitella teleta]|uniref:THAP-type domain-containing protein n=1 Tax=Capitella teleta TaxID=283909 RepID=R7URQ8_CAPTE|nr:hypothetical protein CAPTEDRAFT_206967 [Capitella teleta]|eukprot:ELU08895.1 hypothetical protein CAPTEDRAFT_206967 [Capitella teleta]